MKRFALIVLTVILAVLAIAPMCTASAATVNTAVTGTTATRRYVSASNGGYVNLRAAADTSAAVLFQVGVGRPVEVQTDLTSGWSYVAVQMNGSYVYGYMMTCYLSATDPSTAKQTFTAVSNPYTVYVVPASAGGVVSMWTATRKTADCKLRDLSKGEHLTVIAASNAWYQVYDGYGHTGYVAKAYVMK